MAKEGTLKKLSKEWTLVGSLTASGLPAAIYALQNSLLQISYKNLDSLTFSMLNQTKIIFTALFTYIILRYLLDFLQLLLVLSCPNNIYVLHGEALNIRGLLFIGIIVPFTAGLSNGMFFRNLI